MPKKTTTHVTSPPGASYGMGKGSSLLAGSVALPYDIELSPAVAATASPAILPPAGVPVGLVLWPGVPVLEPEPRSSAETRWRRRTRAFSSSGTSATLEKVDSSGRGVADSASGVAVSPGTSRLSSGVLLVGEPRAAVRADAMLLEGTAGTVLSPRPATDERCSKADTPAEPDAAARSVKERG